MYRRQAESGDSTGRAREGTLSDMWRFLEKPWVRFVARVESLGAFGQQIWGPLTSALAVGGSMIGALFGYLDGYGWLGSLAAALITAVAVSIVLLILAKARAAWGLKGNRRNKDNRYEIKDGDTYDRAPEWEEVRNKTFTRETVYMDSKRFIGCVFDECTLYYNGGPLELIAYQFKGQQQFKTDNGKIINSVRLQRAAGVEGAEVIGKDGKPERLDPFEGKLFIKD